MSVQGEPLSQYWRRYTCHGDQAEKTYHCKFDEEEEKIYTGTKQRRSITVNLREKKRIYILYSTVERRLSREILYIIPWQRYGSVQWWTGQGRVKKVCYSVVEDKIKQRRNSI